VLATYLGSGDPALHDYFPAWVDNLADDATVEGSLLDGAVQGADAVRSIMSAASPSAVSSWSPATPPGRPSALWRITDHAARCSYYPAWCARSSPAPHMASNSLPASP